jgi:hypothetical protein
LLHVAAENGNQEPTDEDEAEALDMVVAMRFVTQSNYPGYVTELHNAQLNGQDLYPKTLTAAYHILQLRNRETGSSG